MTMTKKYNFNDVKMSSKNLAFVAWVPEKSNVKKRMMSATVRPLIHENLFNRKFDINWTFGDRFDLDLEERFDDLKRMRRYKDIVELK